MKQEYLRYDYNIPTSDITQALRNLINNYPKLSANDEIKFATTDSDSGIAMYPSAGVGVISEKNDISGWCEQLCGYEFLVVYKASGLTENRRAKVKEWLDDLGRWLNKQDVDGYKLDKYPTLEKGKEFKIISIMSPSHIRDTRDNKTEMWGIALRAIYTNEFNRD